MDISTYLGNSIIDHYFRNQAFTPASTVYLSSHSADPGLTGANETSGSGYARQAITFSAGSSKATHNTDAIAIPMPSAGGPYTVAWFGVWDNSSGGNFYMKIPSLGTNQYVTGAATGDLLTCYGHGFTTDDRIIFDAGVGGGLPGNVSTSTVYYVLAASLTADVFKVSTASGGGALDLTTDGEGVARKLTVRSLNAGDSASLVVTTGVVLNF